MSEAPPGGLFAGLAQLDLVSLLAPMEPSTFLSTCWEIEPVVLRDLRRTSALASVVVEATPGRLVERSGGEFWYRAGTGALHTVRETGDPNVAAAVRGLAESLHEAGITVYIPLQREGLRRAAQELLEALGRDAGGYDCSLFAVPDGAGARAHIDASSSLTLQLTGTKQWSLAPPPSEGAPLTPTWIIGDSEPDDQRYSASRPIEEPHEWPVEVVLSPGDVLYTPRGWIHKTSSEGNSVAVNINLIDRTWSEPVLDVCRAIVFSHLPNREAMEAFSGRRNERIAKELNRLGATLGAVSGADVTVEPLDTGIGVGLQDEVARNQLVTIRWARRGQNVDVIIAHPLREDLTFAIPAGLECVLHACRDAPAVSTVAGLVDGARDRAAGLKLMDVLIRAGAFSRPAG